MGDSYIDYTETQTYGPHFVGHAAKLAAEQPIFRFLGKEVDRTTKKVGRLLTDVRQKRSSRKEKVAEKDDVLPEVHEFLRTTSHWVKAHPGLDVALFFPDGVNKLRRAAAKRVLAALETCSQAFSGHGHLPEAKERRAAAEKLAARLAASIDGSHDSRKEVVEATPELKAAREEWLAVYAAAKLVAEGMFRLLHPEQDPSARMRLTFADLEVVEPAKGKGQRGQATTPVTPSA